MDELQKEAAAGELRKVLETALGVQAAADYTNDELKALVERGYTTERWLLNATREGLKNCGLSDAKIDELLGSFNKAVNPPAGAGSDDVRRQIAEISTQAAKALAAAATADQRGKLSQQETAALRLMFNRRSQVTATEIDVAKVYYYNAGDLTLDDTVLPQLTPAQLAAVGNAVRKVLDDWNKSGGIRLKTLDDAAKARAGGSTVHEANHMQPLAMQLIRELGTALNTELKIVDTHSKHPIGGQGGAINCSLLSAEEHEWPYLVCPVEFKVKNLLAAFGQIITRCRRIFDEQPDRGFTFGVGMTCETLQLLRVYNQPEGGILVQKSAVLKLADNNKQLSAQAPGVVALAQVLAAGCSNHGYKQPFLPQAQVVQNRLLTEFRLVQQGGRPTQATVYKAKWQQLYYGSQTSSVQGMCNGGQYGSSASDSSSAGSSSPAGCTSMDVDGDEPGDDWGDQLGDDDCVVKVGLKEKEVTLLTKIEGLAHVVQKKADFKLPGSEQTCVILQPCCSVLRTPPALSVLAKLGYDVAAGVGALFLAGIYHRDISRNNIGLYKKRGYLFDFSAAKEFGSTPTQRQSLTGHPRKFTGTPLYAAVCVLEGEPHSVSSDLESVYYSLRHIAYDMLPDQDAFQAPTSGTWALARRGACMQIQQLDGEYAAMMRDLHGLFWPEGQYWYDVRKPVTVDKFQDVCTRFCTT